MTTLGAWIATLTAIVALGTTSVASAQSDPRFVRLGSKVKGVLYMPDSGPPPKVGILVMHEDANFLIHIACTEFSKRGYAVMCVAGRSDNNEALDTWNELPLDAALGVRYLRDALKLPKVLLFAHSGGGPLLSFYQALAENGPAICRGPTNLTPCGDELAGLPKADGMVFFDAHPGTAINLLRSLDPSVVHEDEPDSVDPKLDPFNPGNGFNPSGESHYSAEFKERYFRAQAARMTRLVDRAVEIRTRMESTGRPFPDDTAFMIPRASARLMELDLSIDRGTEKPRTLIRNDGSVATQIVNSVRRPAPRRAQENRTFDGGKLLTVRSFLGTRAIRANHAMDDFDVQSNNNSTPAHLRNIHVPILMLAAGGHYFIRDNEKMFDIAASTDKEFAVVEGAAHGIVPCTACEQTKGQYGNSVKNAFDYMKAWIDKRF
ncbi:MAG: alpha/beta hydrolase family protein [Gemmatimonas sp.]